MGKKNFTFWTLFLLCCMVCNTWGQGQETGSGTPDLQILYHQTLHILETSSAQTNPQDETVLTLSFHAFDRDFTLLLQSNNRLLARLPDAQRTELEQQLQLYRGVIAGVGDSWARLSRVDDSWSGMIWDGSEMYVIDSSVEIAAALAPGQQPEEPPQPVIFRLSDAVHEGMTDEVLEPPAGAASPASPPADTADQGNDDDLQGLLENIGELPVAQAATATAQLDVAIVADVQFVSASANPQAQIVAHMNVVDGIYSEQLGVHLNITELQLLNNNGPLTSSDAGTLLDQFRSFVSTNVANPGLAHLFTGRNMNSNVVGVAFLGVLCNAQFGIGLSQTVGVGTVGALIVAHEIGHNFGAPHDNQSGSTCASTGGNFLMNPSINGSDQFSPCSLDQIRPRLNAASCLSEITPDEPDQPDPPADTIDLTVTVPGSPISATVATPFTLTAVVSNGGTATAQNGTLTISLPGALEVLQIPDSCSTTPGAVSCTLPALVAGASSNIILSLQGAEPGNVTSTLTVAVANDTNPVNDTTQAAITLIAADAPAGSDLTVTPAEPAISAVLGANFQLAVTVSNGGSATAENAGLDMNLSRQLRIRRIDSDGGRCFGFSNRIRCLLGSVDASDRRVILLTLQGRRPGSFSAIATVSSSADVNDANNSASIAIDISAAAGDSGGRPRRGR